MKTKVSIKPLTFHSEQIIRAVEGAFDGIFVTGQEVERGAVRLSISPYYSGTAAAKVGAESRLPEIREFIEEMGWSLAAGDAFGTLTVLHPGYCVKQYTFDLVTVQGLVSYEDRQQTKDAKYFWSSQERQWRREIRLDQLESHRSSVPFEVIVLSTRQVSHSVVVSEGEINVETVGMRAGRLLAAQRNRFGGPAKVFRACPYCGEQFGGREMRGHSPHCRQNPRRSSDVSDAMSPSDRNNRTPLKPQIP